MLHPHLSLGAPGVKKQGLVSWAHSQLFCSIVCSGHPLDQQGRRQDRMVLGAARAVITVQVLHSFRGTAAQVGGGFLGTGSYPF